jgi:ABC-type uncharacterized transport system fused permease/ATPase subunit
MTFLTTLATTAPVPTEPMFTWNLFLTAILIPVGLFILFQYIKKEMSKKAKEELDKELIIQKLVKEREEFKDREDAFAHTIINNKLEKLHEDIVNECQVSKSTRDELFDKLSTIDITLKLINGSVKDTKKDLAVHIAETKNGR